MDKQIIEWLNIFAKYKVDDDRIVIKNSMIYIYFTGFKEEDKKRLAEFGWWCIKDNQDSYYYYKI